jgi:hypothetical protein
MSALDWAPVAGVDFARLHDARLHAHYAAQWLARAARAYLPGKADDSHTNLGWDDVIGGLETHKLQGARVGLKFAPLSLAILEGKDSTPSRTFNLDGRKEADVRAWLGEELGHLGLDARLLEAEAPYKIPPFKLATGAPYAAAAVADALRDLAAWFSNANRSLGRIRAAMEARKLEASPVRCWPHHFDIATLIALNPGRGGESASTVGVGLSPGDEHINEPYFYVTPWPYPPPAKLTKVPPIGAWFTKKFTAAVVPAHRILAAEGRQTKTEEFLDAAIEASIKALS